jgi:phage shock protein PspC (stress-responsive transcriptional regulator)
MAAGVAGGIAERHALDPSLVRIGWVVVTLLTGGLALIAYVAMAIIVPEAPDVAGGSPGWVDPAAGGAPAAGPSAPGAGPSAPGGTVRQGPARSSESGRNAAVVLGLILIVVGAFYLVQRLVPALDLGAIWPVVLLVVGLVLVIASLRPRGSGS